MTRAIDFNADLDRLDWNVTGNDWTLVTLSAQAVVELPLGVVIRRVGAWEGPSGWTRSNVTLSDTAPNIDRYTMNGPLVTDKGLEIAAEFDKGVVVQPQGWRALTLWVADFADRIWPLAGLALLCLALLVVWLSNGNRLCLRLGAARTTPPDGLTPATAHLIRNTGFTWNGWVALSAVLFELERKGQITLDLANEPAMIELVTGAREADLTLEDQAVLSTVAERGPTLFIQRQTGVDFVIAKGRMDLAARTAIGVRCFIRSYKAISLCVALWAAMVAFLGSNGMQEGNDFLFCVVATGGPLALIFGAVQDIRRHLRRPILWLWAGAIVVGIELLCAGLFMNIPVRGCIIALAVGLWATVGICIAMVAYTREGRAMATEIEAFRRYFLAGNNADDAEYAHNLPWAVALDAEAGWGTPMAADMATAGRPDQPGTPEQRAMRYAHRTGYRTNCGVALSGPLAAAAPTSSRSNGRSDGSSSGGGGGW